ncbi:phage tail spike protein [uncultured Gemella sp.]|uniref:phage tail spike protein n=1 Tax=uncultured Gemella sp. TaxID=254352 RepID=UPI0028D61661|nr:phage tail spike protein [uncultured Gemella sp.]
MLYLYDPFEKDFTYNGIVLNNAYDSDIHWVLNSTYKLTFKYPTVDNDMYSMIEKGMIVKANEDNRTNLFRIRDIELNENDKSITVTAYQKTFDYSNRLVSKFARLDSNCQTVLDEWYANFLSKEKDFTYWSDITQTNSFATFKNENDTQSKTAFDLLGQIADTFKGDIDLHDTQINVLKKLGTDTQEVLTTAKNISSFVNSSNIDDIVTRLYVTSTFKVGDKEDKKELREQHKKELAALRETQKRASKEYNAKKKSQQMQEEINSRYARELSKQTKKTKRSGHTVKSYSQIANEVANKYRDRDAKAAQRKLESQAQADRRKAEIDKLKAQQKEEMAALDEEITISLVVESPLINDYPFINEMAVSNNELQTAEELEEWAMEHFTKDNIDKPKNSIKVSYEQLSEKISRGDTVILKYLKYDVDERIRIVETHYDPMLERWKSFVLGSKEGKLGSEISSSSQTAELRANAYTDAISYDFAKKVKEQVENVNKVFEKKEELFKKQIEDGIEVSKAKAEVVKNEIREEINNSITELNHKIDNMSSSSIEDLRRQVEENKTISEATIKMMGTEDSVIYSKNRLEGSSERYIPPGTEYIEVTHNGDGFELGQQYTISWEAVCVKRDFYDVTVRLSRALPHAANVMLIDKYGAFPTGEHEFNVGEQEAKYLRIYDSEYYIKVVSKWFKELNAPTLIRNAATISVPIVYLEYADGNENDIEGSWSENPTYIFDGGGK